MIQTRIGFLFFLFVSLFFGPISSNAQDQASLNNVETKALMEGALKSFVELIPYMHENVSINSDESRKKIQRHLEDLKSTFSAAEHVSALQTPSFLPSAESLEIHLDETIRAFKEGNDTFTKMRMNTIASLCMSCHTQLPDTRGSKFISAISAYDRSYFKNDFDYAEFLFMGRSYLRSLRYYERIIQNNLNHLADQESRPVGFTVAQAQRQIRRSLNRILTVHLKVNYDPSRAKSFLERFVRHRAMPRLLSSDMRNWIAEIDQLQKMNIQLRYDSTSEVEKFINDYLQALKEGRSRLDVDSREMTLLVASGVLTKFMARKSGDPLEARALYWLARAERQLNFNFFYSLADIYLRDCIKNYPQTPYAKSCLEEYRENLEYGYTGSAGVDIPEDELKKLQELENYLKAHE